MNDSHDNGAAGRLAARCERFAELDLLGLHVTADSREYFTDLRAVLAENETMQAELDRLWYFIDHQPRIDDIITGRPDHYIINGDHSGCTCGTDWTPPLVSVEWTAGHPYDDGRPGLCTHGNQGEHNARQMASHGDSWVVLRRLVGQWQPADSSPSAPMPTCAPTPNALICACGRPVGHGKPSTEDAS